MLKREFWICYKINPNQGFHGVVGMCIKHTENREPSILVQSNVPFFSYLAIYALFIIYYISKAPIRLAAMAKRLHLLHSDHLVKRWLTAFDYIHKQTSKWAPCGFRQFSCRSIDHHVTHAEGKCQGLTSLTVMYSFRHCCTIYKSKCCAQP